MADYIVRIWKSWAVRSREEAWVNTYEISSSAAITGDGLLPIVNALVAAEAELHLNGVKFVEATVSTWQEDSKPYNPTTFKTYPLAIDGLRTAIGEALDGDIVYRVQFVADTGRHGRRDYRGVLDESQVTVGGDLQGTLIPTSDLAAGGEAFADFQSALAPFLAGGAGAATLILKGTSKPSGEGGVPVTYTREVEDVTPYGFARNRRNHRYFDRV